MKDAIEWAQEQKMRELADKASRRKDGKLNAQEKKLLASVAKADMALGSLSRWPGLSEEDMAGAACQGLAAQALSLIDDERVRAMALEDLARQCVAQDKVAGWDFARAQGVDASKHPQAADRHGREFGFGARGREQPGNWIARAISRSAWKTAMAMAGDPKARSGCPGFGEDGARLPIGQGGAKGLSSVEIDGMEVSFSTRPSIQLGQVLGEQDLEAGEREELDREMKRWQACERAQLAQWLAVNDPLLALWAREVHARDGDGKAAPAAVAKALAKAGFEPRWGEKDFEMAAVALAMKGSQAALEACKAGGIGAGEAVEAMELASTEGASWDDEESFSRAWHPALACNGAVWATGASDKSAWANVGAWLDETMGAGTARLMEERAAFDLLAGLRDWPGSSGHDAERVAKALDWMAAQGPGSDASRLREQVAQLQGLSIEAQESEARRSGPSKAREKLREVLQMWSSAPQLAIKRGRPLKA